MKPLPSSLYSLMALLLYNKRILRFIYEALCPENGQILLDIPCGTGVLIKTCQPSRYVGADIDANRVIEARNRFPAEDFLVADASCIAFPSGLFDRILAAGLFHHVEDSVALKILSEFKRVLKPMGKVVVFEAIWPRRKYNLIGYAARKMDQGNFVRYEEEYETLFNQYFRVENKNYFTNLGLEYSLVTLAMKV